VRTVAGAGHAMFVTAWVATPLQTGLAPVSSVAFPGRTFYLSAVRLCFHAVYVEGHVGVVESGLEPSALSFFVSDGPKLVPHPCT
jgi:hypothetical protein